MRLGSSSGETDMGVRKAPHLELAGRTGLPFLGLKLKIRDCSLQIVEIRLANFRAVCYNLWSYGKEEYN